MYRGKRVGVVVPAHNEGKHIRTVIETLPSLVDRAYVIDDCSTDETWAEIRAAIREAPAGRGVQRSESMNGWTTLETDGVSTGSSTGSIAEASADDRRTDGGVIEERDQSDGGRVSVATTRTSDEEQSPVGGAADELTGGMAELESDPGADSRVAPTARDALSSRLIETARSNGDGVPRDRAVELPVNFTRDGQGPPVVAIRHETNRGRGAAVKNGYRRALDDGMEIVVVMDGDGQMNPDDLESIVHPVAVGRADYAKGNRLDGPEYWDGMSRFRLFGNLLLTGLTRVASGYWRVRDPQNGYTAISREALLSVPLEDLYDDYGFLNDMLVKLHMVDARVADVALPAIYGDEVSGIRYSRFIPTLSVLLFWNFLARLYHEGIEDGYYALPVAYGLGVAGWLGALVAAVLAGVGVLPGIGLATVGWLVLVGIAGLSSAVLADGSRSLHLQLRVLPVDPQGGPT